MFDQPKILESDELPRDTARCRAEMKARQLVKIKELKEALIASGFLTLDQQAKALGLARSITWAVPGRKHKIPRRLATINCIANNSKLPPRFEQNFLNTSKRNLPVCMVTARPSGANLPLAWQA
jgi:hypothetical protein